jgi:hypothetical protein
VIGKYSFSEEKLIDIKHFDNIQGGGKNLLVSGKELLLASQEGILNENVSLSRVDVSSLEYINTIGLKVEDPRYTDYTIKRSIIYNDKIIVTGQVLDKNIFVGYPGWNNFQEAAVFFVLDSALELDTILIIPPSSGAFLKIEDLSIGVDSILYFSFYEKYLKSGPSEDYLENRKVVYGFDKNYNKVFQWIGPDFTVHESLSNLAVDSDTNVYVNYIEGYSTYIASLNIDGSHDWELLLDTTLGENLYSVTNLIIAENEDLIGVGSISSVINEFGQSGLMFRIDKFGQLKWKKVIRVNKGFDLGAPPEFPFQSVLEDITEISNGDLVSVGHVRKYVGLNHPDGPYNYDIWIVRLDENGCLWEDCTDVQDIISRSSYLPIVSPRNEWVVDIIKQNSPQSIYRYTFSTDTFLVNEKFYYQLLYSPTIEAQWLETGRFMREENGIVYELNNWDSTEILLYNLDFQTGDTMVSHQDGSLNQRKVIRVGAIELLDEIPRKSIDLECTSNMSESDTAVWIEGIGDIERLFWSKTFCSTNDQDDSIALIRCFLTDKQVLFSRPELEGCYLTSVEDPHENPIKIYPNPADDELHFDFPDNLVVEKVRLYNTFGQLVISTNELSQNDSLPIYQLSGGIYFGTIILSDGLSKTFRVLIL